MASNCTSESTRGTGVILALVAHGDNDTRAYFSLVNFVKSWPGVIAVSHLSYISTFPHFYTPVSLSTRGPVMKLTMLHCSSGKINGLIEMLDP